MSSDKEQREQDPTAAEHEHEHSSSSNHESMMDSEKHVKRNPHPDFKKVEASRPDWDSSREWEFTKTKNPSWQLGDGANDGGECLKKNHVSA